MSKGGRPRLHNFPITCICSKVLANQAELTYHKNKFKGCQRSKLFEMSKTVEKRTTAAVQFEPLGAAPKVGVHPIMDRLINGYRDAVARINLKITERARRGTPYPQHQQDADLLDELTGLFHDLYSEDLVGCQGFILAKIQEQA